MIMKLMSGLKPILIALLIVVGLQLSGFMGTASFYAHSAALRTGLFNASAEKMKKPKTFDYNFMIKDLEGTKISFEKFRGKVVFLNMWATWCGPCRAEMADIQKLYNSVDHDKVVFVMLSIDDDKNRAKVGSYVHNKSFTFPVFMPSGYLPEQLHVPSIPTTFVLSKDGKIIAKEVGSKNYNTDNFKKFLEDQANN
ncbi:MAG: TlpA family protein disulfide reductase [Bacteroidia bacterium]|nr:TlpA family protein disulfide reductase [Bacteroidia bacterium]